MGTHACFMHQVSLSIHSLVINAYQDINGLHLSQSLQVALSMVQVEWHTFHLGVVRASGQLHAVVAPLQQLVVVLDAPLVVPFNEGDLEDSIRSWNDWHLWPVEVHNLHHNSHKSVLTKCWGQCSITLSFVK